MCTLESTRRFHVFKTLWIILQAAHYLLSVFLPTNIIYMSMFIHVNIKCNRIIHTSHSGLFRIL